MLGISGISFIFRPDKKFKRERFFKMMCKSTTKTMKKTMMKTMTCKCSFGKGGL